MLIVNTPILSYDARSEYPFVMMCKDFPKKFEPYSDRVNMEKLLLLSNEYIMLVRIRFKDIKIGSLVTIPYLPIAKAVRLQNYRGDNGRILSAEFYEGVFLSADLSIIEKQYTWDKIEITDVYISEKIPLPQPIKDSIMESFFEKCQLEEEGKKETPEYAHSKENLNAHFGMMYTDPVRDIYYQDEQNLWTKETANICEAIQKFYNSRNSFLYYAWGMQVAALGRVHHNLLVEAFGEGLFYGDTDSGKGIDIDGRLKTRIAELNISIEKESKEHGAYYKRKDGELLCMGVFVEEPEMKEFVTMGAKKYGYVLRDSSLHLTISGVNKTKGPKELGSLDNFREGFVFRDSAGLQAKYQDRADQTYMDLDGHRVNVGSGVSMIPSTYTLGVTTEYRSLIDAEKLG